MQTKATSFSSPKSPKKRAFLSARVKCKLKACLRLIGWILHTGRVIKITETCVYSLVEDFCFHLWGKRRVSLWFDILGNKYVIGCFIGLPPSTICSVFDASSFLLTNETCQSVKVYTFLVLFRGNRLEVVEALLLSSASSSRCYSLCGN